MTLPDDPIGMRTAIEAAKSYADAILMPTCAEIGGMLGDAVGQWRLRNRARVLLRTKQHLQANGIDPAKLQPEVFVPLMEACGDVSDETLSSMFASLLAGHLDPATQHQSHPGFAKVLGQLAALDAKTLLVVAALRRARRQFLNGEHSGPAPPSIDEHKIVVLLDHLGVQASEIEVTIALGNLERLGIVRDIRQVNELQMQTGFVHRSKQNEKWRLSVFGQTMLRACSGVDLPLTITDSAAMTALKSEPPKSRPFQQHTTSPEPPSRPPL